MSYDYGKIWVTGASGRVGRMIRNMLDMREVELFETDKEDLDITSAEDVTLFGLRNRPNTIINCAGLTDLKMCEQHVGLSSCLQMTCLVLQKIENFMNLIRRNL